MNDKKTPLFNYHVEVILIADPKLYQQQTPRDFKCPRVQRDNWVAQFDFNLESVKFHSLSLNV